jgi:uncharacterized protein (TIGR02001 family)
MQKKFISLAVASILVSPLAFAEDAPAPASPLTFNVGVVSDYLFRGVSQTHGKPALQGGVDYAFDSGFYVGAWASNITWVKDWLGKGSTEIDVYGGYKGAFANPDFTYDVGYITYNYPGHGGATSGLANPNTQEVYVGLGYKWLSAKYSYATSSHFIGWYGSGTTTNGINVVNDEKTRGSSYLELNANYDMGDGWTAIGHIGHQKVKNITANTGYWAGFENADYTDWKIGVSKDVGFGTVTLAYSDTNAKGTCSSGGGTSAYCWGNNGSQTALPNSGFRDAAKGTAVLSFLKTF